MKAVIMGGPKLVKAIFQFYEWLREQREIKNSARQDGCRCAACKKHKEDRDFYGLIGAKMRTLFAGLIEFEEKQE